MQNWELSRSSVDYLAAENAASPAQHFWSLSVEEQFYVVWPVLVLLLVALATRRGWRARTVVLSGLAVVVVGSLAYSVHATATEPASAYFVTPTRLWELGLGGLLGVLVAGRAAGDGGLTVAPVPRAVLAWAGFAAIGWSALTYTATTPFPGWRALVPVLGTVAVLAASDPGGRFAAGRVLDRRPVQFLGDVSYSVYLWHWPLVVLVPYVSGGHLGRLDKATILVATLLLSWASKVHVEDRFRSARGKAPLRRTFLLAAGGMAVVLVLAGLQIAESSHREDVARQRLASALAGDDPCFGAAAAPGAGSRCEPTTSGTVVPAPAQAATDKSEAYDEDCFEPAPFDGVRRCTFGDSAGSVSLAVVGNSHMGHWLPAIDRIAQEQGWKVTTFMSSECTASKAAVEWDADVKQTGCRAWADKVLRETATGEFDLVVTSERNGRAAVGKAYDESYPAWLEGYRDAVAAWVDGGAKVLVIHDTATPGSTLRSVPDCLAQHADDFAACAGPRSKWVPRDPLVQAAQEARSPDVTTVDLNDYLCDTDTCPAVIGGVVVYFDASHLTATYSRTLAPYLAPSLTRAVQRAAAG